MILKKGTFKSHMVSFLVQKHKCLSLWVLIWNINWSSFIPLICPELHCADEVKLSSPMILPFIFSTVSFVLRFPPAKPVHSCYFVQCLPVNHCLSFFFFYCFNWQNLLNLELKSSSVTQIMKFVKSVGQRTASQHGRKRAPECHSLGLNGPTVEITLCVSRWCEVEVCPSRWRLSAHSHITF